MDSPHLGDLDLTPSNGLTLRKPDPDRNGAPPGAVPPGSAASGPAAPSGTALALDDEDPGTAGPGLLASLWRFRLVLLGVTVLAALAGAGVSLVLPVRHQATAILFVRDPGSPAVLTLDLSSRSGDHAVFMAQQAGIAGSDEVLGRALRLLEQRGAPADLRESVEVTASADLASLAVTASSDRPDDAIAVANAVGTAYQQLAGERIARESRQAVAQLRAVRAQREDEFDSLKQEAGRSSSAAVAAATERKALHVANLIGALQVREDDIAAQAAVYGSGVDMFERATRSTPSRPGTLLFGLVGAALGLVLAGGWAWRAAGRDPLLASSAEVDAVVGVPMLGELQVPRARLSAADEVVPPDAETYHLLLASLDGALARGGGRTVAIASATADAERTRTVLGLARAGRREGRAVTLVDADEHGELLSRLCPDDPAFEVVDVDPDGSRPAAAGDGAVLRLGARERDGHHPGRYYRSPAFADLLRASARESDLVLVDVPPLLEVAEGVAIVDRAEAVLLMVRSGTPLAQVRQVRDRLALTTTPLVGYVLVRGPGRQSERAAAGLLGAR